jgi:putative DNA primase/helicase
LIDLKIAYGNSRLDKKWVNKKITFDDLCRRFQEPRRSTETVAEYQKFPKARRDQVKDVGGFVLGHLIGGRRKKDTVEARSGITLDADHADVDFVDRVEALFGYRCAIYSTHSHTPETPRLRVVIPLTREVTPDEYSAVSRLVADEIGMDYFDDSTYEPERLMYWPSCPADGQYVFRVIEGAKLNPDSYLTKLSDWRDCTLWPTSSRQSAVRERAITQQQDPLTKEGVVGAFCRAYSIEFAIETFLTDVYQPSVMPGRYDYTPADSSSGLVVYGGKFAYSHHATDPASGRLLNAFDLVRVHKFADQTEQASFQAMSSFANNDEAVSALLLEEHRARARSEFPDDNWEKSLSRNKQGKYENSILNLLLILTRDKHLQGIRFNKLANQIYAESLPWPKDHPGWRDADTAQLVAFVAANYCEFTQRNFDTALTKVAEDRAYHPIRDYLDSLPVWDQVPRIDRLFIDYLGADDTEYVRAVTRKTLVAAVARVKRPGIKFDSIPVLNGGQGIGKSTLIARLGRGWYSDSLSIADMKDKTASEKLQGNWLLEVSEMAGIRKMDVETVKAFASRIDDQYRPSYGRVVENHPRQCIIIGTTNSDGGFLRDLTGNRRFWPVRVTGHGTRRPWDLTETDISQIWAEAITAHDTGEELFLAGNLADIAADEQRDAMETDDREGVVAAYLDLLLPVEWEKMDVHQRREYLRDPDGPTSPLGITRRDLVCNMEIWVECFEKPREAIRKTDSYEIEAMIKSIGGWQRYTGNTTGKLKLPLYGQQHVYERIH